MNKSADAVIPKCITKSSTSEDRGKQYGPMVQLSALSKSLKNVMHIHSNFNHLNPVYQESLDMIMLKIARVVNGNPNNIDSWHDIAGYAKLSENEAGKWQEQAPQSVKDFEQPEKL